MKNEVGILNPLCGIGFNSLSLGRYTHISPIHYDEIQLSIKENYMRITYGSCDSTTTRQKQQTALGQHSWRLLLIF